MISDIHGQYDALMEMVTLIQFSEEDELYILGDVIDRGPKSVECMRWIRMQDNVLTLLGNHELMLYDGHIPTMQMRKWFGQKKDFSIWKNKSETIIDIDCGAGYPNAGGRLGCLRLNDMEEFYINLV